MIFKLLASGRQFLVATGSEEQQSLAVCEHAMAVSESPESVAVSLPSKGALFDTICRTHEFTLALPPKDAAERVAKCSRAQKSARFVDMFSECGLTPARAQSISSPVIEEAAVNIECRLSSLVSFGDRSLIVGEIVNIIIHEEKLDEKRQKTDAKDEKQKSDSKEESQRQKTDSKDEKQKPDLKEDSRQKPEQKDDKPKSAQREEK